MSPSSSVSVLRGYICGTNVSPLVCLCPFLFLILESVAHRSLQTYFSVTSNPSLPPMLMLISCLIVYLSQDWTLRSCDVCYSLPLIPVLTWFDRRQRWKGRRMEEENFPSEAILAWVLPGFWHKRGHWESQGLTLSRHHLNVTWTCWRLIVCPKRRLIYILFLRVMTNNMLWKTNPHATSFIVQSIVIPILK
jgi:hypothetical protein